MGAKAAATVIIHKRVSVSDLASGTTAYSINFDDRIEPYDVVRGAGIHLVTKFNGTGVGAGASTVACDVGDGTDVDGYVDNFAIGRAASAGIKTTPTTAPALLANNPIDSSTSARTPAVKLTGSSAFSNYTAGEVIAFLVIDRVPGGRVWN